jgi:hypothetical protein
MQNCGREGTNHGCTVGQGPLRPTQMNADGMVCHPDVEERSRPRRLQTANWKLETRSSKLRRKLAGKLIGKLLRKLPRKLSRKLVRKLTSNLVSSLSALLVQKLLAKLGSNLAEKLAANLASMLDSNLVSNLVPNLDLNLNLNLARILVLNLPGGQSLVRPLHGRIVVRAVPDHYT